MFATRRKEAKAVDRVILHIDMNNFYASVETLYDPSLKDIPMAVGGDKERRHGIVLAPRLLAFTGKHIIGGDVQQNGSDLLRRLGQVGRTIAIDGIRVMT